ncbi:MAG TPA: hypothetical protein VIP09_00290 [Dehalococcoidia bacterium]
MVAAWDALLAGPGPETPIVARAGYGGNDGEARVLVDIETLLCAEQESRTAWKHPARAS